MLKAPFPWFGGKSRVADIVWDRFGDVANYVEPFFGSGAVLLARPHPPRIETVNDLDCHIANFWRAVQADPEAVAKWCDWPVNEADLHARHLWLVQGLPAHRERMMTEPDYFDAKIAGWWVWGQSSAILGGWPNSPTLHLGPPCGVQALRREIHGHFQMLTQRLRRVRVLCDDWLRCLSVTWERLGDSAILLDPPYLHSVGRATDCYREENASVATHVRTWAIEHGKEKRLKIALCGYDDEHDMPPDWECVAWTAGGCDRLGEGKGSQNRNRERIWFSPHCLGGKQRSLSPSTRAHIAASRERAWSKQPSASLGVGERQGSPW